MEWSGSQNYSDDTLFGVISSSITRNDGGRHRGAAEWSSEEKKLFKDALTEFDPSSPDCFEKVASRLPWKSVDDVKIYYHALFNDPKMIHSSQVPVDNNDNMVKEEAVAATPMVEAKDRRASAQVAGKGKAGGSAGSQYRRRGIPWTEEEHQLFLMGLNRYGKGDWKSISRYYVTSKTPTQVASHAQKYYRRQASSTPLDRRRPSIHDIQTVNPIPIPIPTPTPSPILPSFSSTPAAANFLANSISILQPPPPPLPLHVHDYTRAYGQYPVYDPAGYGLYGSSSSLGFQDPNTAFFPGIAAAGPSSSAAVYGASVDPAAGFLTVCDESDPESSGGAADGVACYRAGAYSNDYLFSSNPQPWG